MDSGKSDNERELTSTMGNVLSVSIKDEKSDTSDATPTSSTDANTTTTSSQIVSDDPISSTSSDVVEQNRSRSVDPSVQSSDVSQPALEDLDKPMDPETDLLEMSISSVSREKITEDVEDLVHDLESLLGESTDSFNIPIKRRDHKISHEKDSSNRKPLPVEEREDVSSLDDPGSSTTTAALDKENVQAISSSPLIEPPVETELTSQTENNRTVDESVSTNENKKSSVQGSLELQSIPVTESLTETETGKSESPRDEKDIVDELNNVESLELSENIECASTVDKQALDESDAVNVDEKVEDIKVDNIVVEDDANKESLTIDAGQSSKGGQELELTSVVAKEDKEVTLSSDGTISEYNIHKDEVEEPNTVFNSQEECILRDNKTETVHATDSQRECSNALDKEELETVVIQQESADGSSAITEIVENNPNENLEKDKSPVEDSSGIKNQDFGDIVTESNTNIDDNLKANTVAAKTDVEDVCEEKDNSCNVIDSVPSASKDSPRPSEEGRIKEPESLQSKEEGPLEVAEIESQVTTPLADLENSSVILESGGVSIEESDSSLVVESMIELGIPKPQVEITSSLTEVNIVTETDVQEICQQKSTGEDTEIKDSNIIDTEIKNTVETITDEISEAEVGKPKDAAPEAVQSDIVKIDVVPDIPKGDSLSEQSTDDLASVPLNEVSVAVINLENVTEAETESLVPKESLVENETDIKEANIQALDSSSDPPNHQPDVSCEREVAGDVDTAVIKSDDVCEQPVIDLDGIISEATETSVCEPSMDKTVAVEEVITISETNTESTKVTGVNDSDIVDGQQNPIGESSSKEDKPGDIVWVDELITKQKDQAVCSQEIVRDEINSAIENLEDKPITVAPDTECVTFLPSAMDSDSEDTVPTLVLEPDDATSPHESSFIDEETKGSEELVVHSSEADIPDSLPEIEEILNDPGTVDDVVENIDMQENLETILAVASLQNAESIATDEILEPQISDKERMEMEALRKAVESITEAPVVEYTEERRVIEVAESISSPMLHQVLSESVVVDKIRFGETSESDLKHVCHVEKIQERFDNAKGTEKNERLSENPVNVPKAEEDSTANGQQTPQVLLADTSGDKTNTVKIPESVPVLPDSSQSAAIVTESKLPEHPKEKEVKVRMNERPKRHKKTLPDNKLEELSINVDVPEREKPYSPKITIKPIKVPDEEVSTTSNSDSDVGKGSLKMTITKQSDKMHSILKICESENPEPVQEQDEPIPKLIIKPKIQQVEQQHSPKMSTRSSKQMYSPTSSTQRSGSPRITIKPVVKPPDKVESISPLKIKIKPEETSKRHSPKLNIKLVTKPEDECREAIHSPRKVIIKPVVKSPEQPEQMPSPRITIKPILKPESEKESVSVTPKLNIKPIKKLDDEDLEGERERSSPKITIKPVVKPQEPDPQVIEIEDEVKERIVLKINKGNLPTPTKESKKREHPPDDEKSEKLAKITVKFSKGSGHAHIVPQPEEANKRTHEEVLPTEKIKKAKIDNESPVLTRSKHKDMSAEHLIVDTPKSRHRETEHHCIETRSKHCHSSCETPPEAKRAKVKETPHHTYELVTRSKTNSENSDDVKIIETKNDSPIVISEDSRSQDSGSCIIIEDSSSSITSFANTMKSNPETPATPARQESAAPIPVVVTTPTPRKRGRPRKVPIVVREEFKEQEEPPKVEPPKQEQPVHDSGRPKRSCRGQSVRATLGIKPRKPRGPGRGRGSKRGMGTRVVAVETKPPEEEPKVTRRKRRTKKEILIELHRASELAEKEKKLLELPQQVIDEDIKRPAPILLTQRESITIEVPSSPYTSQPESIQGPEASPASLPVPSPKLGSSLLTSDPLDSIHILPPTPSTSRVEPVEIVMVDEETRMSADTNSRAQTPAKQVLPADSVIEESQSSVQSTGTTESGKASRPNKAPRLEVQEPEGAVISADQLTEYYWNGNGPFMLQEQVAQFLGIKSFKRKYPGIMRRMLEMQERDFIRESGLASEHMCDLGLTAVNSADILDIMYSDFQDKYEEYCKHQRDRQAKELINKQKALSLAASQEKNKADITEQAVQSAAQWNASFNKTRKEQRKACMDLQTLTVHYPKGKMKQINKPKVGNYPVALVPGQFTDYYKEFTPTEINNLPLSTLCYDPVSVIPPDDSDDSGSDGSDSDSDSSTSSSGSCTSSSGVEDCKLCKHTPKKGQSTK